MCIFCVHHTHTHTQMPLCVILADLRWVLCADEGQPACTANSSGPGSPVRGHSGGRGGEPGKRRRPHHPTPTPRCWAEGLCSGLLPPCLASAPVPLEPRQQPRSELGKGAAWPPGASSQDTRGTQQTSRQVLGSLGKGQTPAQHAVASCYSALPKRVWINNN